MKNLWIIFLMAGSIVACKNSSVKPIPEQAKSYLPVTDFIREDIKKIDSFGGGILLKTSSPVKNDSAFIQPRQFQLLVSEFFLPELDSAIFYNQFTETSLMDETTQMLNFIYTADSNKTALRKVIVYVSPSLTTDKVHRIYMEKENRIGDTIVSQKLTWKMRQYLIIAEIKETRNGFNSTRILKAIWNPQHYAD